MSLRRDFVALCEQPGANVSELCRRFGISRKTGYKWMARSGEGLQERSRRPHRCPGRTAAGIEAAIVGVRERFPDWGARKLKRFLENDGWQGLPAVSTVTAILHRHGRISAAASEAATHWQRFEHPAPNLLWQMDFKGHFAMARGRCHPLTVLDDHSRYSLLLHACTGENRQQVQPALIASFRRYGLPERISCDNGPPWGTTERSDRLTRLGAWLIRLGIRLSHARPGHPQTNGKDERFHRTLKEGLLRRRSLSDLTDAQHAFDAFREIYNHQRPHDALALAVPASRYQPSPRAYPETLPAIDYHPGDTIRKVDSSGPIAFRAQRFRVAKALIGQPVALRPDPIHDGSWTVFYCHQPVKTIHLNHDKKQP